MMHCGCSITEWPRWTTIPFCLAFLVLLAASRPWSGLAPSASRSSVRSPSALSFWWRWRKSELSVYATNKCDDRDCLGNMIYWPTHEDNRFLHTRDVCLDLDNNIYIYYAFFCVVMTDIGCFGKIQFTTLIISQILYKTVEIFFEHCRPEQHACHPEYPNTKDCLILC